MSTDELFFFEILSDLHQAMPNHLADEGQARKLDANAFTLPLSFSSSSYLLSFSKTKINTDELAMVNILRSKKYLEPTYRLCLLPPWRPETETCLERPRRFFFLSFFTHMEHKAKRHRGKVRCCRWFHSQGRSSDNFENQDTWFNTVRFF